MEFPVEADIYARFRPHDSDKIDRELGEDSYFHETFGYYAQGVGPETSVLPKVWEGRLTLIENENTGGAKAYCIDVHDLACAKLVASRPKDLEFVRELFRHNLVDPLRMAVRVGLLDVDNSRKALIMERVQAYTEE